MGDVLKSAGRPHPELEVHATRAPGAARTPLSRQSSLSLLHRKMVLDDFKGRGLEAFPAWHATGTWGVHQQSRHLLRTGNDCADVAQCCKGLPGHKFCASLGLTAPHMLQQSASHKPHQL